MAALVPDQSVQGQRLLVRWRFDRSAARNFWLACSYRDTSAQLAIKLDARYTECQIQYQRRAGPPPGQLNAIECH